MPTYRVEMDIESNAVVPDTAMAHIPDIGEYYKVLIPSDGEIKSLYVRRLVDPPEHSYDARYLHGAN
jgi:hypothetical protein